MNPTSTNPSATGILKQEHRVIETVLRVLERIVAAHNQSGTLDLDACDECVRFIRLFADACHHGKEEDMLFPALEQCGIPREGGPIGMMLYEHTLGRQFTREMAAAVAAARGGDPAGAAAFCGAAGRYVSLLSQHIMKEDNVLFNLSEHALSESDRQGLCGKYCDFGCRTFEGRTRDELAGIAEKLAARWLT